jgi:hypothetical protein
MFGPSFPELREAIYRLDIFLAAICAMIVRETWPARYTQEKNSSDAVGQPFLQAAYLFIESLR